MANVGLTLKKFAIYIYIDSHLKFRFKMVRVTENILEPTENGRGLFNYLWDGVKLSKSLIYVNYMCSLKSHTRYI